MQWISAALGFAVLAWPAWAGPIDLTSDALVVLGPGARMEASFSIWNYARANAGYDPWPTEVSFQAIGPAPAGVVPLLPPGSTGAAYPGFTFSASLLSEDRSVVVPLGDLVIAPGVYEDGEGPRDVAVLRGAAHLDREIARELFGDEPGAILWLRNGGPTVTFGLGEDRPLRAAFSFYGLRGQGPVETGAILNDVSVIHNAEPATFMLIGIGLIGLALLKRGVPWFLGRPFLAASRPSGRLKPAGKRARRFESPPQDSLDPQP